MSNRAASAPPRPVVICGPSGVGKGTLIELLQKHFATNDSDNKFGFSVSHTTRKPREGEVDGVHYNFSTVEEMKKEIDEGKFVEYANVHGNYYGTSVKAVQTVQQQNKICILDIDIQGVQTIKSSPSASALNPIYLFIAPPSMEALEKRLRGRGTETEEAVTKRLKNAKGELEYGMKEGNFDKIFVNEDLDKCLAEMAKNFEGWYPELLGSDKVETTSPRPVVICGPSGVGKGTLIELLQKHFAPNKFGFSVSHTTRKPREGEVDGVHYNFSTVEEMKKEIDEGKFLEYANVHGNYYGTSIKAVQSVQQQNKICILDIDIQGVQTIKSSPSASALNPIYLFIAPPSMGALEKRLRGRGTETEEAVTKRLKNAKGELEYGMKEGNFDKIFVNEDLDKCLAEMVKNFEGWYPELLGSDDNAEINAEDAGEESIPPPVVDPLSFPQTDEGLNDLLSKIDQECPMEGYIQTELNYHASNVYVPAGKKLDIPLPPVEQDGSKIEWSVTLVDEHNERLDIEYGLVVIVDGEEVVAREMGRILSPSPYKESREKREGDDDATASTTSSAKDDEVEPSAKGKFTIANSAPVSVIIKLNNSYSWFTPKKINYSFTIIPPVDDNMKERSLRAKSVLPKIVEGKEAAMAKKEKEKERTEALNRIKAEMEEKMNDLNSQMANEEKEITFIQKRSEEAEAEAKTKANEIKDALTKVKKEEQSIDELSSGIIALEEECARLKAKWEELHIERKVREEEKEKLEQLAEQRSQERGKLQEEIASKKEAEKTKLKEMEVLKQDRHLMQENLRDLEKEKSAREAEEAKYAKEVKFFQKQMDAVKLRFIEPKSS